MLTNIIGAENYNGSLPNNILSGTNSIENRLNFSQYNLLENQLNQIAEPEDPPETMHTPWGIWRHWRDALHSIDERYDTEHVLRKGRAAEDILHNAHYVPVIGDPEHKEESYEMNLEYDDPVQLEVYNSKINLKEYHAEMDFEEIEDQSMESPVNTETEDDSIDSESKDIDEERKEQNSTETPRKNINSEDETELTKIFEKVLKIFSVN